VRVLVTGSEGFIGAHAVRSLTDAGLEVRGLDRLSPERRDRVDIRNRRAVERAMAAFRPDAVLHLGALATVPGCEADPDECLSTNVLGTVHVARCAAASRARLVFASSAAVYGDGAPLPTPVTAGTHPDNLYGVSKIAGERVSRMYSPDATVLRFFNVYGEGCHRSYVIPDLIRKLRGRPISLRMYGTGREARDFVYIGDVVRAIELSVLGGFQGTYNVGSGKRTSLKALAGQLTRIMGQPRIPVRFTGARPGDFRANHADISGRNHVPGWTPRTELADGLRRTLART
jgi:UDP-glucose 4-epimerase